MKVLAFLITAMVMLSAVVGIASFSDTSEAESAPTTAPEIKFWVYEDSDWVAYSGHGYYVGQAIANSGLTFTWGTQQYYNEYLSGEDYTYQYESYGVTYTNINPIYGKLATVNGIDISNYEIYRYKDANWNPISSDGGMSVLGFYKPFDDCQLDSANIAFVPKNSSYDPLPTQGTPDSAYAVTFHIGGNTYVGYGSDCATAFHDAMVRNQVAHTVNLNMINNGVVNNNYYGFMTQYINQIMGQYCVAEYDPIDDVTYVSAYYTYWALYVPNPDYDPADPDSPELISSNFMAGFLSPLSYVPTIPLGSTPYHTLVQNELTFAWEDFTYNWVDEGDTRGYYPPY
ncbi:MAG: hypothetical protein J6O90_01470 [Candidatus Methanomethylophilaceae archaeon]|nr:hypothetical protein [Candidatus Methanomethylophilaceae archaeon]